MNVAVFGLGKLGQPMAVVLARAGFNTIAYDVEPTVRSSVENLRATVDEPGLAEEMLGCHGKLVVGDSFDECVGNSDIGYVIVPTPSLDDGSFTNQFVIDVIHGIGSALRRSPGHYTVVVCSTMMPGSTSGEISGILSASSGRPINDSEEGVSLVYSPQFIALGSVLHDMRNPDVLLVGTDSERAAERVTYVAETVFSDPESVHLAVLPPTEAEIVKIGINTYITMKISFANALGQVCGVIPDVDGYRVTKTIGHDSRIGTKYITAGGPYGGPCFPRDTGAFAAFVGNATGPLGLAALSESTALVNDVIVANVAKAAMRAAHEARGFDTVSVLILGTSYKPASPVTEESFGFKLAKAIGTSDSRIQVFAHDPVAELPPGCRRVLDSDVAAFAKRNDVVSVLCSPEPVYTDVVYSAVVDVWGVIPDENARTLINYGNGNGSHLLGSR